MVYKTVAVLREVYRNALRSFPCHRDRIGEYYEQIMVVQMNGRRKWISDSEELTGTTTNMLIGFEVMIKKFQEELALPQKPKQQLLVLAGGKG